MSTAVRRPTIRDVAAKAGVSKSLVSLVYSSPQVVSDLRRQRVLEAAAELGFTPNFLARSLAAESGTFIGILVADLHNPLFAEIVDHVRAELEERGQYGLMTSAMVTKSDGSQAIDKRTVSALIDLRPKSVLVVGSIPHLNGLAALPEGITIVIAGAAVDELDRAHSILSDDRKGVMLAVNHLVAQGHSRIAYIRLTKGFISDIRSKAYQESMKAHGLSENIQIESQGIDAEHEGYLSAQRLLISAEPPTAIICYNDLVAIGAQQAINEAVARGEDRVALIGHDNTYLAALKQISITSIDQNTTAIAMKSAEILASEVSAPGKRGKVHLLEPRLIVRDSSNFAPQVQKKGRSK